MPRRRNRRGPSRRSIYAGEIIDFARLRWPDARAVDQALRLWARRAAESSRDVIRIGYFGSYARGDWGPGSDVDIIMIVERSDEAFERRSAHWNTTRLPVPTDVLVYTREEWERLSRTRAFHRQLRRETVWVHPRADGEG